jgi:8-oxo-dGTP pyrophosphatase MutT (NUDIX family)
MRQYASAGAIVVTTDLRQPRTLLLDQVRATGERQTVAAKGRLEPGEAPLAAALREVGEEAGLHDVLYAGYLGRQAYGFTDNDGTPATKTVDWFLFAADDTTTLARQEEGFTTARWIDLDTAAAKASHAGFSEYLHRAANIVAWRQQRPLPFSTRLDTIVRTIADQAAAILAQCPEAGLGICGSAARGDYVEGWSDIDLIGWGLPAASPRTAALLDIVRKVGASHGVRVSLHFADEHGRDIRSTGPAYDMKLQAALQRVGTDVPVVAGVAPMIRPEQVDLLHGLQVLHEHSQHGSTEWGSGLDRDRRLLSLACSTARTVVVSHDPDSSLRLPDVVHALEHRWPGSQLGALLREYDAFRRAGAAPAEVAGDLAERATDAVAEIVELVEARTLSST